MVLNFRQEISEGFKVIYDKRWIVEGEEKFSVATFDTILCVGSWKVFDLFFWKFVLWR